MKIVTWNIEWMNRWFTGDAKPQWGSRFYSADEARIQAQKAANVIKSIDAEIMCIQEGPSSLAEMNLFINDFLSDSNGQAVYNPLIGNDGRDKRLFVLSKLNGEIKSCEYALDEATIGLNEVWDVDVTGDLLLESHEFTLLPLVVDVELTSGQNLRLVVMHSQSKYAIRGEAKWNNLATRQQFVVEALRARRRICADAFRMRSYLDALLKERVNHHVIVVGDFNDGPGQDYFERSYLTHNVTDILLGSTFHPNYIFDHPVLRLRSVPANSLFSVRFDDYVDQILDRPLLLDHILVSPTVSSSITEAGVANREFELQVDETGMDRVQRPSDHRPVWVALKPEW